MMPVTTPFPRGTDGCGLWRSEEVLMATMAPRWRVGARDTRTSGVIYDGDQTDVVGRTWYISGLDSP